MPQSLERDLLCDGLVCTSTTRSLLPLYLCSAAQAQVQQRQEARHHPAPAGALLQHSGCPQGKA
jgi:hypothetical protein